MTSPVVSAFAVFRMGGEDFALEVRRVIEVLKKQQIREIPEMPDFLAGVIDLRGRTVPVVDLRKRFRLPPGDQARDRVIVLRKKREQIGLVVDDVREVIELDPEGLDPAPELLHGIGSRYLRGIGRAGGRMIVVVDIAKMLSFDGGAEAVAVGCL